MAIAFPDARKQPSRVRLSTKSRPESGKIQLKQFLKYALWSPCHVILFAMALVVGVATWSCLVVALVFLGEEMMMLFILSRLNVFDQYVKDKLKTIEKERAAEQRASLLLRMSDGCRRELISLETVVDRIRELLPDPLGTVEQIMLDECSRLIAVYARLGIAYNVLLINLASINYQDLEERLCKLEKVRGESQ